MPGGMSTRRGMSAKGRKEAIRESKEQQQSLFGTPAKDDGHTLAGETGAIVVVGATGMN